MSQKFHIRAHRSLSRRKFIKSAAVTGVLSASLQNPLWSFAQSTPPKPSQLVVSMFGFNLDFFEKNIMVPFKEKYGIELVYDLGNNSERLAKLIARKDNPNTDVVMMTRSFAYDALKQDLLLPYSAKNIPSLSQLPSFAKDPFDDGGGVAIAYTPIDLQLAYRTDKTESPITSWRGMWRSEFNGFVTIPDMTGTFGPASLILTAKAFGGSENDLEPGWKKLEELMSHLTTIYTRTSATITLFQQEEVWIWPIGSFGFGSFDNSVKAADLPSTRIIPEEGLATELNVTALVKGRPEANTFWGQKYMDFLLSEEVQLRQAQDQVDSPINLGVTADRFSPDVAKNLVFLGDQIGDLLILNQEFLSMNKAGWIERFNKIRTAS